MNYAEWLIVSLVSIQFVLANQTNPSRPKIVGGYDLKIREVPFLLGLNTVTDGFICGAVILSASWGMSALHCVKSGVAAKNYFVRAGSSMSFAGGSVHRVSKFYSYDSKFFDGKSIPFHDIVLFRIRGRFRFSNKVRPAKLPVDDVTSPDILRISGWGRTYNSKEDFPWTVILKAANVTKVTWEDCIATTSWYESVVSEKRHLCYGEKNTDACYGDSGGPLADSQTVYGIVSFGNGCGVSPGVYTKITFYRQWIKRIAKI